MVTTHFGFDPNKSVCGRGNPRTARISSSSWHTDCGMCKRHPAFVKAAAEAIAKRKEEFDAQIPRVFSEPWKDGLIQCRKCNHEQFRYRGRSCYGHYDDFVCANCGETTSRLTETGMSF